MKRLDYSIVIATRNRPAALRLSIPMMLGQSRPPVQLIVVDSSDDHPATVTAVNESVGDHPVELIILQTERGLTRQRNLGLKHVTTPVVFFPDDDSIWFPGVAQAQMEVYEKDEEERIAAVCAAESPTPPPTWQPGGPMAYQMRASHRFQQRIAATRSMVENFFFPDPAKLVGRSFWPASGELPDWFFDNDVVLVEWMTGFRMSFRTSVIRNVGFDENFTRYSLFEDIDASFSAWRYGWVVGARKARVFHYRSPENRDQGRRLGAEQLLNKAYVVAKHTPLTHTARRKLRKFACYKILQYRLGARNQFGRERFEGARAAFAPLNNLSRHQGSELSSAYIASISKTC